MFDVLRREGIYLWYYFGLQLEQIFGYWVLGIVFGPVISVFAKGHIHSLFRSTHGTMKNDTPVPCLPIPWKTQSIPVTFFFSCAILHQKGGAVLYSDQLETFIRAADVGSFNKAAGELLISPPAVIKL